MTIRDVLCDFTYQPPSSAGPEIVSASIVGSPQTFLARNSYDAGPFGAALTELTALDTILTVGGQNFFVEQGAGQDMKLVVDWVSARWAGLRVQTQLITSA